MSLSHKQIRKAGEQACVKLKLMVVVQLPEGGSTSDSTKQMKFDLCFFSFFFDFVHCLVTWRHRVSVVRACNGWGKTASSHVSSRSLGIERNSGSEVELQVCTRVCQALFNDAASC